MILNCLAIDDEILALELLEDNIKKIPFLNLAASCNNAIGAMQVMQQQKIDLVISDIQMPSLNGLQFVQSLPQKPMVIFITAYEDFAVESFAIDVVDYLVKPVAFNRFLLAANKAMLLQNLKLAASKSENNGTNDGHVFLNVDYGFVKVYFEDVVFVEALKDYVKIHLRSTKKPIIARMTMKGAEDMFPKNKFLRVHKSFIVAEAAITAIKKQSIFLGDVEIPVGETFKEKMEGMIGKKL